MVVGIVFRVSIISEKCLQPKAGIRREKPFVSVCCDSLSFTRPGDPQFFPVDAMASICAADPSHMVIMGMIYFNPWLGGA
jgi:hypothetical protein